MGFVLAIAAILGGIDKITGNRFGLGDRFDEGFRLLGPLISGMVGILCLSPVLAEAVRFTIAPFFTRFGLDPAVFGGILPTDMGGFQLANELAIDTRIGQFVGVFVTSTFGCTLLFTIPVGFSMMREERRGDFLYGIMNGLILLPIPLLLGGLCCGLPVFTILINTLPVILLSVILILGMRYFPKKMISFFKVLTKIIEAVSVIGILAGLTEYLTGFSLIPGILPLREALTTAALCGMIMVGSLPFAEILSRLLKKPLNWVGTKIGMRENGITSLLLTMASMAACFAVMHDENAHDIRVNAAFLVLAASVFGAHLAVCTDGAPDLVPAFVVIKIFSGVLTILYSGWLIRKKRPTTE